MEDPRIISALFIFLKMAYYNVLINIEPYIRSFRQFTRQSKHSNHRYFIDPRPIGSAPHLWGVFENLLADSYDYSRSLSRSFSPQPLQLTQVRQG